MTLAPAARLWKTLTALLAPILGPLADEFRPRRVAVYLPPTAELLVPAVTFDVVSVPAEPENSGTVADLSATDAAAEPLYVRRGEGRGTRYLLAGGSEPGPRFRRVAVGKRVRWQAA